MVVEKVYRKLPYPLKQWLKYVYSANLLPIRYGKVFWKQTEMLCPKCGKKLTSMDEVERTVETMIGQLKLKRPYLWCKKCSEGFYPLDEALNLSERKKQWDNPKGCGEFSGGGSTRTAALWNCDVEGVGNYFL